MSAWDEEATSQQDKSQGSIACIGLLLLLLHQSGECMAYRSWECENGSETK